MATEPESAVSPGGGDITRLLVSMREGLAGAEDELLSRVYHELRAIAASMMAREAPGQTLQPTALVHEAWLRLFGDGNLACPAREYFFAAVGKAMRRILVENARRKLRIKRGGNQERLDIDLVELPAPLPDEKLLALDEALDQLATSDPVAAKIVDLHFFVGLSQEQVAREVGVSTSTVERKWAYARAWLFREIQREN